MSRFLHSLLYKLTFKCQFLYLYQLYEISLCKLFLRKSIHTIYGVYISLYTVRACFPLFLSHDLKSKWKNIDPIFYEISNNFFNSDRIMICGYRISWTFNFLIDYFCENLLGKHHRITFHDIFYVYRMLPRTPDYRKFLVNRDHFKKSSLF